MFLRGKLGVYDVTYSEREEVESIIHISGDGAAVNAGREIPHVCKCPER